MATQDPPQQGYQSPQYGQTGQSQQQYYPPPPSQPAQLSYHGQDQQQSQQHYPPPPPNGQQYQQTYQSQDSQHYPPPPPKPSEQQQQQQQQQQQPPPPQPYNLQSLSDSLPTDTGTAAGGINYSITHRSTNAVLTLTLPSGASIRAKPGVMIHMQPTVQLQGKVKLSFKKFLTGGEMSESTFTGPGRVALAPTLLGDIQTLSVGHAENWTVGKDAFLAGTQGVVRETTGQGVGKGMFSGESFFVYRLSGQGTVWLTSYGAVERISLNHGEQHIVDNGHLVAWSCNYQIERAGGGSAGSGGGGLSGAISGGLNALKSGEGMVCRFTGPGTIYIQTRNLEEFGRWVTSQFTPRG